MGSSDKRRRSDGMRTNLLPRQRSAPHAELPQVRHHARTEDAWVDARRPPFDRVTISLHWATVLFVLTLFASAWLHALAEARQSELTPARLQIHRSSGVTVWVMTALRLTFALARYWVRFAVGTAISASCLRMKIAKPARPPLSVASSTVPSTSCSWGQKQIGFAQREFFALLILLGHR